MLNTFFTFSSWPIHTQYVLIYWIKCCIKSLNHGPPIEVRFAHNKHRIQPSMAYQSWTTSAFLRYFCYPPRSCFDYTSTEEETPPHTKMHLIDHRFELPFEASPLAGNGPRMIMAFFSTTRPFFFPLWTCPAFRPLKEQRLKRLRELEHE